MSSGTHISTLHPDKSHSKGRTRCGKAACPAGSCRSDTPCTQRGFTLLEVLLVLGILILLAAIVTPSLFNRRQKAMIRVTRMSIVGLEGALKLYAAEHEGEYPDGSSDEVFKMLMNPGTGEDGNEITPYIDEWPTDGWGQSLHYEFPTSRHERAVKPAIWSSGPDEENDEGSQDDINNWDEGAK